MAERDLLEEVNYLSGCAFAHDVIVGHFAAILIAAGAIEKDGLEAIINGLEGSAGRLPSELYDGYQATLQKLRENLIGSV